MKDDQWFLPGDKVTRVTDCDELGVQYEQEDLFAHYGKVVCVAVCCAGWDGWNVVQFVGQPQLGFYAAACFRRVSEIQLCVRAAEKFKKPVTEEEEVEV